MAPLCHWNLTHIGLVLLKYFNYKTNQNRLYLDNLCVKKTFDICLFNLIFLFIFIKWMKEKKHLTSNYIGQLHFSKIGVLYNNIQEHMVETHNSADYCLKPSPSFQIAEPTPAKPLTLSNTNNTIFSQI